MTTPAANPLILTPVEWQQRLTKALRDEQLRAQQRIAAARASEQATESFDRDVAGWLATGLIDLLNDPVTAASFLQPPQGVIARLAENLEATRFAEADFQRPDNIRFMEASRPAQAMLTKLSLSSTAMFRAAAARLMNLVAERLATSALPIVEEPASAAEPMEEPTVAPDLVDPLVEAWNLELARLRLFAERGLAAGEPPVERDQAGLDALRARLTAIWKAWFTGLFANFDAEEFLAFEEVSEFFPAIARVQDAWTMGAAIDLPLPRTADDFDAAERLLDELRQRRKEWRQIFCTPWDIGPSFDAAVAAGGAPLDMLNDAVRYWLQKENRDWSKYRIIRID